MLEGFAVEEMTSRPVPSFLELVQAPDDTICRLCQYFTNSDREIKYELLKLMV
jgi:hypothetical protein